MELQASINKSMLTTGVHLQNNMKIVDYVLKYAHIVYNDFIQKGMWDKCINVTPGQSGLLTTNPTDTVSENYVCFNCGKKGKHKKENCPDDVNKERQKLEREKFNLLKGRTPRQSTSISEFSRLSRSTAIEKVKFLSFQFL